MTHQKAPRFQNLSSRPINWNKSGILNIIRGSCDRIWNVPERRTKTVLSRFGNRSGVPQLNYVTSVPILYTFDEQGELRRVNFRMMWTLISEWKFSNNVLPRVSPQCLITTKIIFQMHNWRNILKRIEKGEMCSFGRRPCDRLHRAFFSFLLEKVRPPFLFLS